MRTRFRTAGEHIQLNCRQRFLSGVLSEGLGDHPTETSAPVPDIRVTVEDGAAPFDTDEWDVLTRNAWRRPGEVVLRDACSSGLDLLVSTVSTAGPCLEVRARLRPPPVGRVASAILRSRVTVAHQGSPSAVSGAVVGSAARTGTLARVSLQHRYEPRAISSHRRAGRHWQVDHYQRGVRARSCRHQRQRMRERWTFCLGPPRAETRALR